jgi:hypothetical protein
MSQNGPGVTTEQLMQIAMEMAGQTKFPADSRIMYRGRTSRRSSLESTWEWPNSWWARELGYDCVMAHHPDPSVQTFPEVLDLHVDIAVRNGVPEDEVRPVIETMKRNQRLVRHSANYDHAPSFARLLNMPYLNIHNPLDEIGRKRMQDAIDAQCGPDATVDDVMAALNTIPEIKDAPTNVELRLGKGSNKAGEDGRGPRGGHQRRGSIGKGLLPKRRGHIGVHPYWRGGDSQTRGGVP